MINDGHSWADIEEAAGEGAFDRYYDILDPDLVSLWTIDAIVRLNRVVREYIDHERSVTDASNEASSARLDCDEDLPWDKIAENMGFSSAGGCIYVWKSFGDGRPLPKKDDDDGKCDLEENNDHEKAKEVDNNQDERSPLTEQVRRSSRRPASTQQSSWTRSRNLSLVNPMHLDLIPATHARKVSLDELPSADRRLATSSTRSQVQLQKLIDTRKLLQELSLAKLQVQERRHRELGRFLEGVAFCKRQRDTLYKGDDIGLLRDELAHLSQLARVSIQGKITSKKIATWLKGSSTPTAISPPEGQLQQDEEDEELQDEDGYLSDLSTLSNEEMTETYTPEPSGRMLRRAISLEDMKNASSLHHLLQEDDHPQRPASSASMSLPVPSNTLSSHHHEHQLQTPYQVQYPQYPDSSLVFENSRAQSAMSLRQHEDNYTLYNYNDKHNHHDMAGTTEGDPDDLMSYGSREPHRHVLDDGKSTRSIYTTSPSLREYYGSRVRTSDETTLSRDEQRSNGLLGWLHTSPIFDSIITWVEGPANHTVAAKKNEKPNPIMDIPFQFIALLTYPEPDPRTGNKMTLASKSEEDWMSNIMCFWTNPGLGTDTDLLNFTTLVVRETTFVRQRRKTLLILTAYTFIVRYCSWDFFLVLLFASNCGMLFLMKNSGRMNVNMAKRAVNQRVGWAKQWAGGIFRRNGGVSGSGTNNQGNNLDLGTQQQQQYATSSNMSTSKSLPGVSSAAADPARGTQTSNAREKIDIAQEDNHQTKRRGLFGKRRTINSVSSTAIAQSGSASSMLSPLADGVLGGDESQPGRTPKRGFFKRNTTTANRSATTLPSASITLNAGPVKPSSALASPPTDGSNNDPFQSLLTPPTALSPSFQSQAQSLPQFQLLPPRSPSPSAARRDISWAKPWGAISPPAQHQQQNADSPPPSASVSTSASPIAVSVPTLTPQQSGRSLASINPRSFLSGFTQSQKQQQQQQQQHSVSTVSSFGKVTTNVIPTSPRLVSTTNLPTILANDQDHMDILAPSGVILFEGDEIGESALDSILPVSKFSSSPETLSVSSFTGTPYVTTEEDNGRQGYTLSKEEMLDPVTFLE
ncbi:hypothetical protein BGX26_006936 [Mortierella sp. AD094]|nr:hypothetical protein BGX26_006936 [Mortierella sp. AD094]